jgi:hypothetical protein
MPTRRLNPSPQPIASTRRLNPSPQPVLPPPPFPLPGARSVNNPFIAAYNCGACCGREGGPNARVFARYANDREVRRLLAEDGVHIDDDTWFVGGYHDTTSDLIELYDTDAVPASHQLDFKRACDILDEARAKNALERTGKFYLSTAQTPAEALRHVEMRSRDIAEVRPELGHSTNAGIILGRRELTKGRFYDRRLFLPHYDPFNDDDEGTNLATVLAPALVVGSGISLEYFFSTTDGGAGTKVPVNVVGNFALQQGTAGDLLIGLATQMSELHSPQRALYLVDAPIDRVEACLSRNAVLKNIVRNNWVKFFVRDPISQKIYRHMYGEYTEVEGLNDDGSNPAFFEANVPPPGGQLDHVPFDEHGAYCEGVKQQEDLFTLAAGGIMLLSSLLPLYEANFDFGALDTRQGLITAGATLLGASNLAYSRRYLHGEFMYGRMVLISAFMLFGFNLVVSAPGLEDALLGWSIIGFSSTFLIGGFNDRPTARDNAAFAYSVYQISDAALLMAAAFSTGVGADNPQAQGVAAFGLIVAASIKSSQFPLSGLFLRSMEGASPNSALGYAGISAHAGVVLLAGTMPMWFQFEWARALLAATGALTIVQAGTTAQVRSDRKGGVASASAATLGALFCILAAGFPDAALVLSLGHASFRMNQVVRAPGSIQEANKWEAALGQERIASEKVFEFVWRIGWFMSRLNSDFIRLPDFYAGVDLKQPLVFYNAKTTQTAVTVVIVGLAAAFHLPAVDEAIGELMVENPLLAAALISVNVVGSTALIRFLFGNVLDFGRFRNKGIK